MFWFTTVPNRTGATRTRTDTTVTALTFQCVQEITATKPAGADAEDPSVYQVARGTLRLEFHLLFLRLPNAGAGGEDIVIGIKELQRHATKVWLSLD